MVVRLFMLELCLMSNGDNMIVETRDNRDNEKTYQNVTDVKMKEPGEFIILEMIGEHGENECHINRNQLSTIMVIMEEGD